MGTHCDIGSDGPWCSGARSWLFAVLLASVAVGGVLVAGTPADAKSPRERGRKALAATGNDSAVLAKPTATSDIRPAVAIVPPLPPTEAGRRVPLPQPSPRRLIATPAKPAAAKGKTVAGGPPDKPEPPKPIVPAAIPAPLWTEAEIADALKSCVGLLAPLAVDVEPAGPIRTGVCGAPAAMRLKAIRSKSGQDRVELSPPITVNCAMIAALARYVEDVAQPAARELLQSPIASLHGVEGYVCRMRNGSSEGKLSEHAKANAVDILGFKLADGRRISVLDGWGPTARDARPPAGQPDLTARAVTAGAGDPAKAGKNERRPAATEPARTASLGQVPVPVRRTAAAKPTAPDKLGAKIEPAVARGTKSEPDKADAKGRVAAAGAPAVPVKADTGLKPSVESRFLKRLHKEACGPFGTVLGPEANEAHRNHFHFDLAERRRSAYCQ
ncbi:MAG: extensin family protein [Hyphomicrobiaceae bacterium]|nr:extensin family protein [Hyphomicrobiaceae bacterium]